MSTGRLGAGDTAIQPTIFDAKGDLIVATAADTPARLAVGSNNQVLMADSSQSTGVKWGASAASTLTATGDLLYASAANTPARLGIGSTGQVLTVSGGVPAWGTLSSAITQIADTTVTGSTAADITFSSISGSYNHLMIIISGRTSSAGENGTSLSVQVNGDTGTNYRFSRNVTYAASGSGVTVTSGDTQSALRLGNLWVGKVSGDYMANAQMIFPDYKSTTLRKTMLFSGGAFSDAPGVGMGFAQWQNTNAITSIKIFSTTNFDIGTRATLYGLV